MQSDQKKQIIILVLLLGVLAVVFFVIDPFHVLKKKPAPTPAPVVNPKATTPVKTAKTGAVSPIKIILADTDKNKAYLELLPPIEPLMPKKYKTDPLNIPSEIASQKTERKLPVINYISSIGGKTYARFKDLQPTKTFYEGDNFSWGQRDYRILRIYRKRKASGIGYVFVVKVVDIADGSEYEISK